MITIQLVTNVMKYVPGPSVALTTNFSGDFGSDRIELSLEQVALAEERLQRCWYEEVDTVVSDFVTATVWFSLYNSEGTIFIPSTKILSKNSKVIEPVGQKINSIIREL